MEDEKNKREREKENRIPSVPGNLRDPRETRQDGERERESTGETIRVRML